jgi:fluoride exporter
MYAWVAVAVGGAIGSVARHGINRLVHQEWPLLRFPLATVIVNVIGCCIIGLLAGFVSTGRLPISVNWREFVFVGILGGFTTFSTFGLDTITLIRAGDTSQAMLNVLVQVVCGLGGVYVGLRLVEHAAVAGGV